MRRTAAIALAFTLVACRRGSGGGQATAAPESDAGHKVAPIVGLCRGAWCFEDPLPTGEELVDVVSGDRDDAIIATAGGPSIGSSLIRWDGGKFTAQDVNEHVTALYRAAAGNIWATTREGVLLHGDGRSWKVVDIGSKTPLASITGLGPDRMWAVGDDGVIAHFDGASWIRSSPVKERLRGVRARARNDVWAAGDGVFIHFDGASWSVAHRLTPGPRAQVVPTGGFCGTPALMAQEFNASLTRVGALSVLGEKNVIAAAGSGRLLRFDGKSWSEDDLTGEGLLRVNALFGGYAVGDGGIAHWDGKQWSVEKHDASERLNAIHGGDEKHLWVVGSLGAMLRGTRDKFERVGGFGSYARLRGMHVGADEVFAVGEKHTVLRRRSPSWERVKLPQTELDFFAVGGTADTDVWAMSSYGPAMRWDGKGWSESAKAPAFAPSRVRMSDSMWALGALDAARWDGKTWRRDDGKFQLLDVFKSLAIGRARDATGFPVFSVDTLLLRWDGAKWTKLATITGSASGIGGLSPDDAWIATPNEIFHFDGKTLTSVYKETAPQRFFDSVVIARSKDDVTVAGHGGAVHYDGHAWTVDDPPLTGATLAGGPAGVFAFTAEGAIARRR